MSTELQQLREEIAKLRERVAVLEASPKPLFQPGVYPALPQFPVAPQYIPPFPGWVPGTITCHDKTVIGKP